MRLADLDDFAADLAHVGGRHACGRLQVHVSDRFPSSRPSDALVALRDRRIRGTAVLDADDLERSP